MSNLPSISPVTGKPGVVKKSSFRVADICELYRVQLNADVSRSFNGLKEIDVLECTATGYRFYYPYEVAGDGPFYEELQRIMDQDEMYYRPWGYDHEFAYQLIQPGEKVLDIGCGSGNFLKRIREKTDQVTGLEFNNAAIEKCRAQGFEVYPDMIGTHAEKRTGYYDVVCIFQVLEHIHDIKTFLDDSLKALRKGGKLIIGVPNNEPYFLGRNKYSTLNLPPHHMGLWNKKAFEALQQYFPVKLTGSAYERKGRWSLDAYYRAKDWLNIKSLLQHHTRTEKIKMMLLAPVSVPISLFKKLTKGINGGYIVVLFEKL